MSVGGGDEDDMSGYGAADLGHFVHTFGLENDMWHFKAAGLVKLSTGILVL